MYDFPSCEKRYTLKCGDVLKAFFYFLLLLFKCRFVTVVVVSLKKKKKKNEMKEVSVFRNTHAK